MRARQLERAMQDLLSVPAAAWRDYPWNAAGGAINRFPGVDGVLVGDLLDNLPDAGSTTSNAVVLGTEFFLSSQLATPDQDDEPSQFRKSRSTLSKAVRNLPASAVLKHSGGRTFNTLPSGPLAEMSTRRSRSSLT